MFVITVYDYICVYDSGHSSKSSNMLNKTSSAFKQSADKQTQQQSNTFVYAQNNCNQSGGFLGHGANIACV